MTHWFYRHIVLSYSNQGICWPRDDTRCWLRKVCHQHFLGFWSSFTGDFGQSPAVCSERHQDHPVTIMKLDPSDNHSMIPLSQIDHLYEYVYIHISYICIYYIYNIHIIYIYIYMYIYDTTCYHALERIIAHKAPVCWMYTLNLIHCVQ